MNKKQNFTHYLEIETVEKAYEYGEKNGFKKGEVIERALKIVYTDQKTKNDWMEIAHGYEYENTFLRKELDSYRGAIDEFAVGFKAISIDSLEDDAKDLIFNLYSSLLFIKREV